MTFIDIANSEARASKTVIQPSEGVPRIDLRAVKWPNDPFGFDHAKNTAQLCLTFAAEFEISQKDERILWTAAMFHDLGRKAHWTQEEPMHRIESARLAAEILTNDPDLWADVALREGACKLIMDHTLNRKKEEVTNVLEKIMWDAEIYESVRFAPGTHEGLLLVKDRLSQGLFSGWANHSPHLKKWMEYRGWKKDITNVDKSIIL